VKDEGAGHVIILGNNSDFFCGYWTRGKTILVYYSRFPRQD